MDKSDAAKIKDKVKRLRRLSRSENKVIKPGSVHEDKRHKRVKKGTNDYIEEVEAELEEE